MKKIAFLLAIVMAFAVCAFAVSCTNTPAESSAPADESAPAESTPADESKPADESAPADESEPAAESSEEAPAESSEDEPAESSEEPVEPSEDEPAESSEDSGSTGGNENLALNKPYEKSELFRQGGADSGWGYDPDANETYPDENGVTMTDGVIEPAEEGYGDPVYAGFSGKDPHYAETGYSWIRVDLGKVQKLKEFYLYCGSMKLQAGIKAIDKFDVLVSDDGKTFTEVGSATVTDSEEKLVVGGCVEKSCSGRYVEFRFYSGAWMFITEVEVY